MGELHAELRLHMAVSRSPKKRLCRNRLHILTEPGRCRPCRQAKDRRHNLNEAGKERKRRYNKTPKGRARNRRYDRSEKGQARAMYGSLARRSRTHQSALAALIAAYNGTNS